MFSLGEGSFYMKIPSIRQRPSATGMRRSPRVTLLAMAVGATAYLSAPPPTFAVPIAYMFDPPVTGVLEDGNTGKITGTFTFDDSLPNSNKLLNVDLMVSGVFDGNGEYNIPDPLSPPMVNSTTITAFRPPVSTNPDFDTFVVIRFSGLLTGMPANVSQVEFHRMFGGQDGFDPDAGAAVPVSTPEPATIFLLSSGLLGLFIYMLRRRQNICFDPLGERHGLL
jgi:hypothetical protein